MLRKNIKKNLLEWKENIVNVDDNEENVNEKIILQNDEHNNNIDLDEVD